MESIRVGASLQVCARRVLHSLEPGFYLPATLPWSYLFQPLDAGRVWNVLKSSMIPPLFVYAFLSECRFTEGE